nr:hypothetical protein [Tanacetum cinerariifolium]
MLADSLLPTIIWSEAVATACYVLNREDDSDSDDEPNVLIIQSTPTLVVPIVDEATTQNNGKEEADQLGLAFPSLNLILGVGSTPIGSSVFAGSTPPISASSTPLMSSCASPISADQYSIFAGKCHVSAGRPTGSAGRPVSVGKPTGFSGRHVSAGKPTGSTSRPVYAGKPTGSAGRPVHILGKLTSNTSSERFPQASSVENLDIHDGLKIFDYPKSGIFTSSSYDEDFSGPDANNWESSLNVLITLPDGKWAIRTKWILKNKRDARVIVCRNKARLVAQGHRQEEGIDYTDVFAHVARIKAIRLFLAFPSFIGFRVYQMDVKSAFLYRKIAEEHGYRRGSIDKTIFIKKNSKDIMLVQVYVDDIIFLALQEKTGVKNLKMQNEFEMSSMGPLT